MLSNKIRTEIKVKVWSKPKQKNRIRFQAPKSGIERFAIPTDQANTVKAKTIERKRRQLAFLKVRQ